MEKRGIDQVKDKFAENMRLGIVGPESGGRYDAQNSEGTAAGKYQFTKFWLKNAKGKSIQAFAKNSNGVFKVPETMEDFKADPILQDAYFDYYAKEVLFPQAQKAYQGPNPAELTLEEMGALFHFKGPNDSEGGTGAIKQIKTGKFDEATKKGKDGAKYTNSSSKGYLNHFKRTLESSGGDLIKKEELIESGIDKVTDPDKIYNEFLEANKAIDEMPNLDDGNREVLRRALHQKVANEGNSNIINQRIQKENEKNAKDYQQEVINYNELLDVSEKIDITYTEDAKGNKKLGKQAFFRLFDNDDKKQWEKLVKLHGIDGKGPSRVGYKIIDMNKFAQVVKNHHKKVTGEDLDFDLTNTEQITEGKTVFDKIFNKVPHKDNVSQLKLKNLAKVKDYTPLATIEVKPEPKEVKDVPKGDSEKTSKEKVEDQKKEEASKDVEKKEDISNEGEEYYNRALGLYDTTEDDFAMGRTKREVPIDLVMGGMLTAIGNKKAKEPIPLRDEEMSNAFNRFAAELAEKSKLGLPVEVEAKMKSDLAEVYQGGLENIKNASGGNRALILGNQASLENAKMKGTVDIQMADYAAKEQAFQQYGQAVMYKNEFDSRRDIANHGIEYNEAKEKQMEGRSIAAAGMNQMIEGIKYQKENGPGSANAMYKSLMMQKIFGFDPNMVDDGTGQKGTKSAYDMQKQKDLEGRLAVEEDYKQFGILNPEQKKVANQVIRNTNDQKKIRSFQKYLIDNPDLDLSKIKMENLDIASQREDWGILTMDRAKAIDTPINDKPLGLEAPNTINLTPEQLQEDGGALEPLPELNAFGNYEGDDMIKKFYESKGLA